jgi:hypothetical protein
MSLSSLSTIQNIHRYKQIIIPNIPFSYEYTGTSTLSTMGIYNVLELLTPGTLTISGTKTISYYVIGGGGGGGRGKQNSSTSSWGGNGGNGGVSATSSFTIDNVANNTYSISVGNGGAGRTAGDGTQGGTSSIIGNSLNISCARGLGGRGGLTSQAINTTVSGSALGGTMRNTAGASNGGAGINIFIPNNTRYGGAGGGGTRLGAAGLGGSLGGGNGSVQSGTPAAGSQYGAGGGGSGGIGGGGSQTGGAGFKGVVFLYWE